MRTVLERQAGWVVSAEASSGRVAAAKVVILTGTYFTRRAQLVPDRRVGSRRAPGAGVPERLTPRQREVLQLLTEGKSNKEIGTALGVTTKTAETHRAHILARLELHSMSELVRYAIRNHIIEP